MTPCSEQEGDRRQAEAQQLRFERAHDKAWSELQTASPASAGEVWAKLAALDGDKVPIMMAEALRALTGFSMWDSDANRQAIGKARDLLRLVADQMALERIGGSDGV